MTDNNGIPIREREDSPLPATTEEAMQRAAELCRRDMEPEQGWHRADDGVWRDRNGRAFPVWRNHGN